MSSNLNEVHPNKQLYRILLFLIVQIRIVFNYNTRILPLGNKSIHGLVKFDCVYKLLILHA